MGGILSDVVVAAGSEAGKICPDFNSEEFVWKCIARTNIWHYVALLAVLSKQRMSKTLYGEFPVIFQDPDPDGEAVLWKLSEDLVILMSKMKDRPIPKIAQVWIAAYEEYMGFPDSPAEPGYNEECLVNLRELSRTAIKRKESLLFREIP